MERNFKKTVYDYPMRVTHWLFVFFFTSAFAIAKLIDDESFLFSQHMILGILLTCTAFLRICWGLLGSPYAKFNSFPLNPIKVVTYLRELFIPNTKQYFAHNPASAWAAIAMIFLAVGLGVTGYLMTLGYKESLEDIHELLAHSFALIALAHVSGVVLHQLRHKDQIAFSMIHGKKVVTDDENEISNSHPVIALFMIGIIGFITFQLTQNMNSTTFTTNFLGLQIHLGDNEHDDESEATD